MSDLRNIATRFVGRVTPTLTALLANALALMLCCLCFVGTTFAWFTSSNSSGTSSIVVGNLDVGLYVEAAEGITGDTLRLGDGADAKSVVKLGNSIQLSDTTADSLQTTTDGTIALPTIYVVNTGTLSAKYQVKLYETDGGSALGSLQFYCSDSKVSDGGFNYDNWKSVTSGDVLAGTKADSALKGVVEVESNQTPAYQFEELHLYIKVKENVSVESINLSNLRLVLVATQAPDETDMDDNTYDAAAQYDTIVTSQDDLVTAIEKADEGATIQVLCNIDLSKFDSNSQGSSSLLNEAESNDSNTAEEPLDSACTLVVSVEADSPQSTMTKITYELRISKNINLSFIDSANLTVNRATGAQAGGGDACIVVTQLK